MIPLSLPHIDGNEWQYVKECLDTGWVSSAGSYVNRFEEAVAKYVGSKFGVACMNGTSALHISLLLCGVKRRDYVILPNITFVASANSIKYTNADPIFIDVDPGTWQMDLDVLEQFLDRETVLENGQTLLKNSKRAIKAIMPVHVLGNICDLDRLMDIAKQFNLSIVEDSTESLGSLYKDRHSGTFGTLGCFSFNGNKIITTGGGGVIVTNDESLANRAKHLTTQAKISSSEYIHDAIGYNYRLVNVLAAIGVAQMEQLPNFISRKKHLDAFYRNELEGVGDLRFQEVEDEVNHNCWLFTMQTKRMRDLLQHLNENGVQSRPFWMPMNQLSMFTDDIYVTTSDHSACVYETALSIPSSVNISDQQLETVVRTVKSFF